MPEPPARPFLSQDAPRHGLSRRQVEALVAQGRLRRPIRQVLVRADLADTTELRARCLALVAPPHVVVTDRTAAWLHEVDAYDWRQLQHVPDLEVCSLRGNAATRRTGVLGGQRDLLPEDVMVCHGVLVTTPLRTACDLACLRGRSQALAVLDAFVRHHGLERSELRRMVRRFAGRRGVKQLRELVEHAVAEAESPGESWVRMHIIDAGLLVPAPNPWVHLPGYGWVRIDLAYLQLKIAVEYDGEEFHTEDHDRQHDEERRDALRRRGWIVIVVTREELSGEGLEVWLGQLRDALAERRPTSARRYSRGETWPVPYGGRRRASDRSVR